MSSTRDRRPHPQTSHAHAPAPRFQPPSPDLQTPGYYGLPAIKAPHYHWLIVAYFFVGGIAGFAQIIASLADLVGGQRQRPVARAGRYLALAGAMISPVLLVLDLHVPGRWYNMLRIMRPSSAMSLGSWGLAAFGSLSGLAGLAQAAADLLRPPALRARLVARLLGLAAAPFGGFVACYTGVLLAATNVPLWAANRRYQAALFGASAANTASAAISLTLLLSGRSTRAAETSLGRLSVVASLLDLALLAASKRELGRLGRPLERGRLGLTYLGGGIGLGVLAPLALQLKALAGGRVSPGEALITALLTLGGGFANRAATVLAGPRSAASPRDYFEYTRAGDEG